MQKKATSARDSRARLSLGRTLAGIGAALALTLAACGSSQRSEASPAAAITTGAPALWLLQDEDTKIYLFGTVHMLKPDIAWLDDRIRSALNKSDTLVLEVVESDPTTMAALVGKLAVNADGPPLSSRLTTEEKGRYLKALADNNIPPEAMERLDPWMVAISLSVAPLVKLGYDQNSGVEKTLERSAREAGKPVIGLETIEQQLNYFDQLPDAAQIAYLNTTVEELPNIDSEFSRLIANWLNGKPDALAEQLNASMEVTPEIAKRLLFDRNAIWADWITQRMQKPGTIFIAVGAGHLAGKNSVIDLLSKRKFKIARIMPTPGPK